MSWILDGSVLLIFLLVISFNVKRGFVKSLLLVVGFVIAVIVSISLSGYLASSFYDNFIGEKVSDEISSDMANFDLVSNVNDNLLKKELGIEVEDKVIRDALQSGDVKENLQAIAGEFETSMNKEQCKNAIDNFFENIDKSNNSDFALSDKSKSVLKAYAIDSEQKINQIINTLAIEDSAKRTNALEEQIVKPAITGIIQIIIGVILFLLLTIIVRIIAKSADFVKHIPLAGSLNSLLGGVIGFLEAIILVYAIAVVIKMFVTSGLGLGNIINIDDINKTILFQIFYNIH